MDNEDERMADLEAHAMINFTVVRWLLRRMGRRERDRQAFVTEFVTDMAGALKGIIGPEPPATEYMALLRKLILEHLHDVVGALGSDLGLKAPETEH